MLLGSIILWERAGKRALSLDPVVRREGSNVWLCVKDIDWLYSEEVLSLNIYLRRIGSYPKSVSVYLDIN